jgi:outer membrane immunogenic protein
MKKILLGTVALLALSASAFAADLPARVYTKAPPAVAPIAYNWTGFYLGGHIGGAFAGSDNALIGNNDGQFMGGGQIGYDYQFSSNWVLGLEANYSFLANDNSSLFRDRGLGSVTGRLGYTWGGPALIYVKGGYAWADTDSTGGFAGNNGNSGYTIGGGLEYMLSPNWSAKLEYQYYNFGDVNFSVPLPPPGGGFAFGNVTNDVHTVKLGVNYRFNWGGGPVAAGY